MSSERDCEQRSLSWRRDLSQGRPRDSFAQALWRYPPDRKTVSAHGAEFCERLRIFDEGSANTTHFPIQTVRVIRRPQRQQRPHQRFNGTLLTGTCSRRCSKNSSVESTKCLVVGCVSCRSQTIISAATLSVSGLLTGGDFLAARDQVLGDFAIIPNVALKSDERFFSTACASKNGPTIQGAGSCFRLRTGRIISENELAAWRQ